MTKTEKKTVHNSTYPKGGVSCSKDSFADKESSVPRINICTEKPAILNLQTVSGNTTILKLQ